MALIYIIFYIYKNSLLPCDLSRFTRARVTFEWLLPRDLFVARDIVMLPDARCAYNKTPDQSRGLFFTADLHREVSLLS